MIDGLGVTGVEGVFRIACEVTMQLLRDNKDSLMSVLDAFIHDPLVEWEDEKRKLVSTVHSDGCLVFELTPLSLQERDSSRRNQVKSSADLASLARNALLPIERKLKGIYSRSSSKEKDKQQKEVSTSNLVQLLIQEATDDANLVSNSRCHDVYSSIELFCRRRCILAGRRGTETFFETRTYIRDGHQLHVHCITKHFSLQ